MYLFSLFLRQVYSAAFSHPQRKSFRILVLSPAEVPHAKDQNRQENHGQHCEDYVRRERGAGGNANIEEGPPVKYRQHG